MKDYFQELRIKKGISQQEVAVKMGLSLTAYRNKEKGRSKFFIDEVITFCKIIDEDPAQVFKQFFLQ